MPKRTLLLSFATVLLAVPTGAVARIEEPLVEQSSDAVLLEAKRTRAAEDDRDPMARQRFGTELELARKYAEALAEYAWCWDEGAKASPGYAGVRRSFLLMRVVELGRVHPPALQWMRDRRDASEAQLMAGSYSSDELADACALNRKLAQDARNVCLFDELRKDGRVPLSLRDIFAREVLQQLADARRYADIVATLDDPIAYVEVQIASAQKVVDWYEEHEAPKRRVGNIESHKSYRVRKLVPIFEGLIGVGRVVEANQAAEVLIQFLHTDSTFAALIDAAARAGDRELAISLAERGVAVLPEDSSRLSRKAYDKLFRGK